MKFALFTHVPWPEGYEPAKILAETTEQVQYGEELGFHTAWFAEHHFSRYSMGSSSLVIAAGIAAATKRIRLGTAVLVPTLHNPIRLAEDAATVDAVSNGRLDLASAAAAAATSTAASTLAERRARPISRRAYASWRVFSRRPNSHTMGGFTSLIR